MHEEYIDRLKGVLIALVVAGHAVGQAGNMASGETARFLLRIHELIYLFHMPAFFFLAGFVWRRKEWQSFVSFVEVKAKRLLIPYAVFFIFSSCIYALTVGYPCWWHPFVSFVHAGDWPNGQGFKCNSVLWFLPVMFVVLILWRIVESVGIRFGRHKLFFYAMVIFMLWLLRLFCYQHRIAFQPWGVVSVLWYLPFVIIGWMCACIKCPVRPSVRFFSLSAAVVVLLAVDNLRMITHSNLMKWNGIVFYATEALIGIFACFQLAQLAVWNYHKFVWASKVLATLGVMSLGIMLIHKFTILILYTKWFGIGRLIQLSPLAALLGVGLVSLVAIALSCIGTKILNVYVKWLRV